MNVLRLVPVSFAQACAYVDGEHRHLRAPRGHKFSIGAMVDVIDPRTGKMSEGESLVGVVIVGRPVARLFDNGRTLEVTRCATDGTRNACSRLYSTAWRAGRAMGFTRMITYTRADENGASLKAAGWKEIAARRPRGSWSCPSRPRGDDGVERIGRTLWEAPGSA
ncbi:XF1762 family protein [Nonomuraea bangladeshensis]|uniref:XF1762 family protein n=1 Tax=Nonomuraea bangladeshensis TaxID=404385 RepID=UPI003C2EC6C0